MKLPKLVSKISEIILSLSDSLWGSQNEKISCSRARSSYKPFLRSFLIYIVTAITFNQFTFATNFQNLDPEKISFNLEKNKETFDINILYNDKVIAKIQNSEWRYITDNSSFAGLIFPIEKPEISGIYTTNFSRNEAESMIRQWNRTLIYHIQNGLKINLELSPQWDKYSSRNPFINAPSKNLALIENLSPADIELAPKYLGEVMFTKMYVIEVKVFGLPILNLKPSDEFLQLHSKAFNYGFERGFFKENEIDLILNNLNKKIQNSTSVVLNLNNSTEKVLSSDTVRLSCYLLFK